MQSCLKPLLAGSPENVDLKALLGHLEKNPKLFEIVQYELYKFCSKHTSCDANVLASLIKTCYSDKCLETLKKFDDFSGCLAAFAKFFSTKGEAEKLLEISKILEKIEPQKIEAFKTSDISSKNLLCLHHGLVVAALKQDKNQAHVTLSLAQYSLLPFKFINFKKTSLKSKIFESVRASMKSLLMLNAEYTEIVLEMKKILEECLEEECSDLPDLVLMKIFGFLSSKTGYNDLKVLNEFLKKDISAYLKFIGNIGQDNHWNLVVEFFTKPDISLGSFLSAVEEIVKASGSELQRTCLLLLGLLTPEMWAAAHKTLLSADDIRSLYERFIKFLSEKTSEFRSFHLAVNSKRREHVCILENLARTCVTLSTLCRSAFKHQPDTSLELVTIAAQSFKLGHDCLIEMSDRKCDERLHSYLWSHLVVQTSNSMEDVYGYCLKGEGWSYLVSFCEQVVPLIATSTWELQIDKKRLSVHWDRWHSACTKLLDHEQAMLVRALQICCCSWDADDAMLAWANSKFHSQNKKDLTFWNYLTEKEKDLKKSIPHLDITNLNQKKLFIRESKAYQVLNSADVVPAISALWKQFKRLKPDVVETTQVLSCLISVAADVVPMNIVQSYVTNCHFLLDLIGRWKNEDETVLCMCLEGIVKFLLFTCKARQSREKAAGTGSRHLLLNKLKLEAEEKAKYGEEVDMNVTCDVVPSGGHLTLAEEAAMITALGTSLAAWAPVPEKWSTGCLSACEEELTIQHLSLIANMAMLYGDRGLAVKAWVLLYRIAKLFDCQHAQLEALSMLIKECEVNHDSTLVKTALQLADQISKEDSKKIAQTSLEVLLSCWMSIANVYLLHAKYQDALDLLLKCEPRVKLLRGEVEYMRIKGRFLCLVSKLLLVSPSSAGKLGVKNVQRVAYNAFNHLRTALQPESGGSRPQVLITMLDVSLWSAAVFHTLMLTPYVRSFVEDLYTVCQRMGLTTRTAQLLALLVQVDLTNREIQEAQLKIANLNEILELPQLSHVEVSTTSDQLLLPERSPQPSRDLSPVRCCPPPLRDASPLLSLLTVRTTHVAHPTSCSCYSCYSYQLRLLAVTARTCEAVALSTGDGVSAKAYHEACDVMLDKMDLSRYLLLLQKELNLIGGNDANIIQREWIIVAAIAKMNYASFTMIKNKCTSLTTELLTESQRLVSQLTYHAVLLQWPLLELRVTAHVINQRNRIKTVPKAPSIKPTKELRNPSAAPQPKTPQVSKSLKADNAPKKYVQPTSEVPETPILPSKRGRRIFDQTEAESKPVPTRKALATPAKIVRPEASATTSIRAPKNSVSTAKPRRIRPLVIQSDSDSDHSPVPVQSVRKTRAAASAKTVKPLIFDETQEKKLNVSEDLFEEFEALKISNNPSVKKEAKKVASVKKPKSSTSARKINVKTPRL